ncbi:MAG: hypothetical protein KA354_00445 [Phycisphaerae bacterium]|nr:hypothetical protein [Phycisphaerae bacterium]
MVPRTRQTERTRRRGTVMILVVGVLAMLFIVGSTLLIVSRFERQTARTAEVGKSIDAVAKTILEPAISALREDVVGKDGTPYNRGWGAETSVIEDYGDLAGLWSGSSVNAQTLVREGDLLLSSAEPYLAGLGSNGKIWALFASSWPVDNVDIATLQATSGLRPGANKITGVGLTRGPVRDADGDGLQDSMKTGDVNSVGLFGDSYEADLRVLPHGGMVLLDRQTAPTLLDQVFHAEDGFGANPSSLFLDKKVVLGATDEAAIRRRFMLPKSLGKNANGTDVTPSQLALNNVIHWLPVTLGYEAPSGASSVITGRTPHYWPLDNSPAGGDPADSDWCQLRLTPSDEGRAESTYTASKDTYDRRHLVTAFSSDDILRPNRDEQGRFEKGVNVADPTYRDFYRGLYYILNPDPANAVNFPANAVGRVGSVLDGVPGNSLEFNTAGLRTAFSLRDVLVPVYSGSTFVETPSYRRVEQLMAYYLAMIQHTTVPGTHVDPTEAQLRQQIHLAAQLAVNTVDFADDDTALLAVSEWGAGAAVPYAYKLQASTYFEWPAGAPVVKVFGVEKQPYLTEAYARVVITVDTTQIPLAWNANRDDGRSVYAVEIYNPYDEELSLSGLELQVNNDVAGAIKLVDVVTTPSKTIAPRSYLVIMSSTASDQAVKVINSINGDPNLAVPAVVNKNVFQATGFKIGAGQPVQLVRNGLRIVDVSGVGGGSLRVVIDEMMPTDPGAGVIPAGVPQLPATRWAGEWDTSDAKIKSPTGASDLLVLDTSLQRPKEPAGEPPQHWYFTLGRQVLFPLNYDADPLTRLGVGEGRMQHNLLNSHPMSAAGFLPKLSERDSLPYSPAPKKVVCDNQWLAWREALGIQLGEASASGALAFSPFVKPPDNAVKVYLPAKAPLAPFPIVTSDRGIDPYTGGCIAFPTTGTLLLVTRYAHRQDVASGIQTPATVAATQSPPGTGRQVFGQLVQVDNGHLPVFDTDQRAMDLDGQKGRFSGPWGQLVYDYFTALPLEELVRPLPKALTGAAADSMGMVDSLDYAAAYGGAYAFAAYDATGVLRCSYPRVEPVEDAASPLGPKVSGRVNVNLAPWWVLDGLPVLPDAIPSFSTSVASDNAIPNMDGGPLSGLPVAELESWRLDPASFKQLKSRPGAVFMGALVDEHYAVKPADPLAFRKTGVGLPSVSAEWARSMVSYRENRSVQWGDGNVRTLVANSSGAPGFASVGSLCDLISSIKVEVSTKKDGGTNETLTMGGFRSYQYETTTDDPTSVQRPFTYLGYLQWIAPLVRLQDWATVKSHVFTIYAVIGDTSAGQPIWLRTQVTVDRTRCLYSNDLPERITETAPIGYYNTVDD